MQNPYTEGTSENDCNFYWVRRDRLLKKLKAQSDKNGLEQDVPKVILRKLYSGHFYIEIEIFLML